MKRLAALAVAGSWLAVAPAQAAVTPVDLGPGSRPSVVMDAAGTAHILFTPGYLTEGATYCRLPRGATACDSVVSIPVAHNATETVKILRRESDGALIALQVDGKYVGGRYGALTVAYSLDNGASFEPATALGVSVNYSEAFMLAPDGQSVLTSLAGWGQPNFNLFRARLAGPVQESAAVIEGRSNAADDPRLVGMPGGRMLAVFESLGDVRWRVFDGGDPLDLNAWGKRGKLSGDYHDLDLASGPRGVYMSEDLPGTTESIHHLAPLSIRSFDTKRLRWRSPVGVFADRGGGYEASRLAQDSGGRLHLVATIQGARNCILYGRTGTQRKSWFGRTNMLVRTTLRAFDPELAVAPDGSGVVAWDERANDGSLQHAWVAPLQAATGKQRRGCG